MIPSEEQVAIRDMARSFAAEKIPPFGCVATAAGKRVPRKRKKPVSTELQLKS